MTILGIFIFRGSKLGTIMKIVLTKTTTRRPLTVAAQCTLLYYFAVARHHAPHLTLRPQVTSVRVLYELF